MNLNSNATLIRIVLFLEKIKILSPKRIGQVKYFLRFGKKANLKDPQNLNEKILWLSHNTDTSRWVELADKYRVRKYVEECGLGDLLMKLYGMYDSVNDIDFEKLPQSFVIKTNNGCGTVILVKDKNKLNIEQTKKTITKWLKVPFGVMSGEPHYRKIKPCIIVEEYLNVENSISTSLIDYKFLCLNGELCYVLVCFDRDIPNHKTKFDLYEAKDWKPQKFFLTEKYRENIVIPKPKQLDKMLEYARILAGDFPQVRVDLYEVDGKVYFGELTFSAYGGIIPYFTPKCLKMLGDKVTLPSL